MKLRDIIRNRIGAVPWMWFIIAAVMAILILLLGFTVLGGVGKQSEQVYMVFSGG